MPDLDEPRQLGGALDDFHSRVAPRIVRPGAAAVHRTVRRRRRLRAAGAVAAAVAVVAGAVTLLGGPVSSPDTGTPTETPATAPTGAPTASASHLPVSQSPTAAAPVSREELAAAAVDLPPWTQRACPSRRHTIGGGGAVAIGQLAHVDVGRDGGPETAAVLTCQGDAQVVVFDRGAAGAVTTVGQVVRTGGAIRAVYGVAAAGSRVRVEVGDASDPPQRQWRAYTWTGQAFQQADGPTSFPTTAVVADLALSATDLTWGNDDGTYERGTMTVTIRNDGPGTPAEASLVWSLGGDIIPVADILRTLDGWDGCTVPDSSTVICTVTPPAAGRSKTMTFEHQHWNQHPKGLMYKVRVTPLRSDDPDASDNEATWFTR